MSSNYHKDVEQWIEFAEYDLRCAQEQFKDQLYTAVCYHGQQAAEKALKAALLSLDKPIIGSLRTHDLRCWKS